MKRSTARWRTAMAVTALCVLPATGWTQTTPTTAQQPSASATADQRDTTQQAGSAQEHLQQARQALDDIQISSVGGQSRTRLNELTRHMNALERSMAANDNARATGAARRSPRATRGARGATNWQTDVAAIDRILTGMLGTTATGAPDTTATGTSGTAGRTRTGAKSSAMSLDQTTRARLEEVRTHITAFAATMSGTAAQAPAAQSEPSASTTTAPTTTAPTTATPERPATAATQTETTAAQPGSTAAPPADKVDQAAAKRHLTEARDTLSQITQLPAAAQLTGDARTQVSQLITNFNELITTNADWHPAYAKVNANLTALLGAESATTTAAPTAGTAGAVGTAGVTATNIDPAIRAKLVEFRTHLQEFERAAGGGAASPASTSASPSPAAATSATTTAPSTTAPSTTAPSTTTPSTTTPAMSHIQAIEAILDGRSGSATSGTAGTTAGTSGSTAGSTASAGDVMLDRAQVEQVRMHLNELRKLLSQAQDKK